MSRLIEPKFFNSTIQEILKEYQHKAKILQLDGIALNKMSPREQENSILRLYLTGMEKITGEYLRYCRHLHKKGLISIERDQKKLQVEFKKLLDNSTRRLWNSLQVIFKSNEIPSYNNLFSQLEKHGFALENQVKQYFIEENSQRRLDSRAARLKIKIPIFRKALSFLGMNFQ